MKTYLAAFLLLLVIGAALCDKPDQRKDEKDKDKDKDKDDKRNPEREKLRRRNAIRCLRETRVRYSAVKRYENGDFSDTSDKSKCFLKCFGNKLGMFKNLDLKVNSTVPYDINEDYIIEFLDDLISDPKQIPGIVATCKVVDQGANACDYAFNAYKCFFEESRKVPGLAIEGSTLIGLVLGGESLAQTTSLRLRLGLIESDEDWTETFDEEKEETKTPNEVEVSA